MNNSTSHISHTFASIKKSIINYLIMIFGLVIVIIFILLSIYYVTPNNYLIITFDNNDKLKFVSEIEYTIKPNSSKQIDLVDSNQYIRFSEQTELVISNSFKSQNVSIPKDNELVKIMYGSNIFIVNNSRNEKNINIQTYLLDY